MVVLTKEKIIEIIKRKTGMSKEEIEEEIRKIMEEDPLLSEQGAAALLAERLGIELIEEKEENLMKISDLYPGVDPREVNVVGRVLKKYPPREYTKKDGHCIPILLQLVLQIWNCCPGRAQESLCLKNIKLGYCSGFKLVHNKFQSIFLN